MAPKNDKEKKDNEKKKTTKPKDANADSTGITPGVAETIVRNKQQDLMANPTQEIGQAMVPPDQFQQAGQAAPVDPRVAEIANQMLPLFTGGGGGMQQMGTTVPTEQPATPYPEPGAKEYLQNLGSLIPGFGPLFSRPLREMQMKKADLKAQDKKLVDSALDMLETNPDAVNELLKSPLYRDAFQRNAGLDVNEIKQLQEISKNLPMSFADTINAIRSGAEVEGSFKGPQGATIKAPIGERERLGKIQDSLAEEAKRAGRDPNSITDLDVAFADAQSQSGRGRYDIAATKKGIVMVDAITGKSLDITPSTLKSSNMEIKPIEDEYGAVLGYTIVDLDDIDRRQEIWFDQAIQQMLDERIAELGLSPENITPEQKEQIEQESRKGFWNTTKKLFGDALGAALEKNVKMGIMGSGRAGQQKIVEGTSATPAVSGSNPLVNKYY